jgi:hypothetical protein
MSEALTTTESARLVELEAVVERGLQTFVEVGRALAEIRDERLYRATHRRFEDYCPDRWSFGGGRARQLIVAAKTATRVAVLGLPPLANEAQARALAPLDSEQLRATWEVAMSEHGPTPTAPQVRAIVHERRAPKPSKPRKPVIAGRRGLSHDPVVIDWVRDRLGEGRSRDEIVRASACKTDGWPRPDAALTNGGVSECRAVIAHLERMERPNEPTPKRRHATASLIDKQFERAQRDKAALQLVAEVVGASIELRKAQTAVLAALERAWPRDPYAVLAAVANLAESREWLSQVIEPGMALLDDEGREHVRARTA